MGRLQGCLVGRPWDNPMNRLEIGLLGRRQGRLRGHLAGRPCGRLLNRLQGRLWNHPDDDLRDDLVGNPWDEPRDRGTNPSPRHGSRAGAWAVPRAGCRSLARASAMSLVGLLGRSSVGLLTLSYLRSLVQPSRGAVPSLLGSSSNSSLVMPADVSVDRVLVCFRFCALSGCGSGRDTGDGARGGRHCRSGPGTSLGPGYAIGANGLD